MHAVYNSIRNNFACLLSALLILIAALLAVRLLAAGKPFSDLTDASEGIKFLTTAEEANPSLADDFLRAKKKERLASIQRSEEKEKLKDDIINDRVDVYSLFKEYVILGDSRAVGFSHFKFLDHHRVLAAGGDTILKVRDHMDKLKKLNPSYIYLCYGVNDAGLKIGGTPEGYAEKVLSVINEIQEALPEVRIYFSSIIWISETAEKKNPAWGKIYEFNNTCRMMCTQNNITYIDNDEICLYLKEKKLWSGDGIHLSKSFYKLWAKNLYLATLED